MTLTVRAAVLAGFDSLVTELGADPSAIFAECQLSSCDFEPVEASIPVRSLMHAMILAARSTQCEHFGLEFAKRKDMRVHLGLLGDIAQSASNLGDALRKVCQLFQLHSEASLWRLQTENEISYMTFAQLEGNADSYKQIEQFALTLLWRFLNVVAGAHLHPYRVHFTFAKPVNLLPYKRTFYVPVQFDADFCGIAFHSSDLKIKLPEHDALLHASLYQQAELLKERKQDDIKDTVRLLIRKNLELQLIGEEYVTRFLPFEKRTLQRRLKEQNTSYRELLNDVRITMAIELLTNSDISFTRIAERLCFYDLANFSKTFRQHTGCSPRAWVQQHQLKSIYRQV